MFFFFFSSRRRHTRWTGDWSSDVCSSDLVVEADGVAAAVRAQPVQGGRFLPAHGVDEDLQRAGAAGGGRRGQVGQWRLPEREALVGGGAVAAAEDLAH